MSKMRKYRTKKIVVEAVQFKLGHSWPAQIRARTGRPGVCVKTSSGDAEISPGDWIVKDAQGRISVCGPEQFEKTYEDACTQRRWQLKKVSEGLCSSCGKSKIYKYYRCRECAERFKEDQIRQRARLKAKKAKDNEI